MSLALEKNCNIDYECLDMIVELADKLRRKFCKSIEQKDIENDLRILKSYYIFERVTPLLQQEYNRGVANVIIKYFNIYANKENRSEYEKLLKLKFPLTVTTIKNNTRMLKKFHHHKNRKIS
ncbi:1346_t:CDS:2 [Dentiscutata erythropus]|uniref:1346_t:CDS:1 n=1 Tax=Dentiscutata erythropus TaxID=1348616 RepID=A0A9N8Z291_9GLOM|nr:1346_t:CDS:2 [Dentiscutata erythropus]